MIGVQTMWSGFGKSVNTYFVQLEERVGAANAVRDGREARPDLAHRRRPDAWPRRSTPTAGARSPSAWPTRRRWRWPTRTPPSPPTASTARPSPVQSITDSTGQVVAAGGPNCHQVVRARGRPGRRRRHPLHHRVQGRRPATAARWSTAPGVYAAVGRPVGGKTGTTDDTRSAWFVGITPGLAAASFIADPDNPFHYAGDGNSQKPVNAVAGLLQAGAGGNAGAELHPADGAHGSDRGVLGPGVAVGGRVRVPAVAALDRPGSADDPARRGHGRPRALAARPVPPAQRDQRPDRRRVLGRARAARDRCSPGRRPRRIRRRRRSTGPGSP